MLSRVQCSTRTSTQGSPETEGRALAATQPHRTRASPRGTAAASSNGCRSHLTTCPLRDVGQRLGLSAINRLLSPDVKPEGCKSWRKPHVGTRSVATYSWAEGDVVTRATALPGRAAREARPEPQPHSRGQPCLRGQCSLREGFAGKSRGLLTCNQLLQGEPSFKYAKLAAMAVAYGFPLCVPGQVASSFNCSGSLVSKLALCLGLTFLLFFFKLAKWLNCF